MAKRRRKKKKGWRRFVPSFILNLTRDQWLDILGYGLLTTAGLTILSFLSSNNGVLLGKWLNVLRQGFGWGAYLTPLFIGAVGLWLVLRDFGDQLPRVTPSQITGMLIGYLVLLVTFHFPATLIWFGGDFLATADAGMGGGHLGALLTRLLRGGLGNAGLIVALLTGWLITIALTFRITVRDGARALQSLWDQIDSSRTAPLPTPKIDTTTPTKKPKPQPSSPPPKPIPINNGSSSASAPASPPSPPLLIGDDQQWQIPRIEEILERGQEQDVSADVLRQQARIIEEALKNFGAPVRVQEINQGPVVTQFGIEPLLITKRNGKKKKVKVSRIKGLADDLALALEAKTLRIEAPIPGKRLVGIEVPNRKISLVALRDVMESKRFNEINSPLRLCLGQDASGHPTIADLTSMPHLLIAGTTGSGKSVCINAIIATLLLQKTPRELKFLMVDPKRVELTGYGGIPHLLSKVVVEMERVTGALQWVLREMDERYQRLSDAHATHIQDYNERVAPRLEKEPLPYIVVIVDELADLMMMAPQETERSLCRIAQMARATGIHLVIATQRPSVDVVTGLIKANFPARIAFNVASAVDSRVILDLPGAERLLGEGDMLFLPPDAPTPMRLQGAFVSNDELRRLVQFWKAQGRPETISTEKSVQQPLWEGLGEKESDVEYEDDLLPDVVDLVLRENRCSISLMQRKLHIGYTRSARIMDILEAHNVVGPQPSGGKAREVFPGAARRLLHPQGGE